MASNFLEVQIHYAPFSVSKTLCQPSNKLSFFPKKSLQIQKLPSFSLHSSPSSVSSPTPPTSKQEAVLQAKTCLSATLQKLLNSPKLAGKLKKQKQPRFRVEIPVADDSPELIAQLAFDVFGDLHIRKKALELKSCSYGLTRL
ncbi:hypothetical protein Nepgr_007546 [Nepenthes gracilis]|uniref:Uncharacterized protein n=1 Tax=Nepenthes gracilis TaxID=150966 RepID=A0AAD3S7W6_NEPGR|nr:hypothetical protein Nepgr_007546 [Nepenthes gracilis]